MLPKSRLITALERRESDRVPIGEVGVDWEITDRALAVKTLYRAKWRTYTALWEGRREEIVESHVRDLIGLARKFEWDFVVVPMVPGKRESYPRPEMLGEYTWRDERRRVWTYSPESGGHAMVTEFPVLQTTDLPDPDAPVTVDASQFEAIERVVKELGETHFVFARIFDGTFPWEETVGMEAYLERMLTDPMFIRRAAEHSDGNHWSILDDFIAAGVDGWQGIQPRIGMDLKTLKAKYGEKLTFFGGVNCETLTNGTSEEVEEEVKVAIRDAGPRGGLVMCSGNSLMPGTRYENYTALIAANRRYGSYPIRS